MKKIEQFQITSMSISGFKSYEKPTELTFGNPTVITGGNGRGKTSIADAIAFAVTGLPLFGERGLDRLHNEKNPDVAIQMRFVDENGITHELTRIRRNNDMSIYYDGHTIRQLDLADLFGERDVFLSILNPLYFIEELGTSGKNLLERYLPFIPQETILAQLPGEVQASLKDEVILSPDAYLKGRRAEIRELEERITYLGGQKDLAATQKKQYETMRVEFSEGITSLQNKIAALAEKQFAGLDTAKMQEQLVELSQRYDEMARDERGDTVQRQKELHALREKIVRRQAEQYQSKFTEPLAEITAKVNDLSARYKRETVAYKAFHAGMDCPTCHRRVTEETLPEVQAALKKTISELYAAGTEQKGQLTELQELDKKARDTFDAFKEADLRKWSVSFGTCPDAAAEVTRAVKAVTTKPVFIKLSPNVTDIVAIARACEEAGADGICLINTLLGMRIDIARRRPVIANTMGGFSGAAVFPVALRMVYQVARACRIPVMGCGGVTTARDVIEMMMAGASAVQVGAANLVNPYASKEIVEALPGEMERLGIEKLSDIIGCIE